MSEGKKEKKDKTKSGHCILLHEIQKKKDGTQSKNERERKKNQEKALAN